MSSINTRDKIIETFTNVAKEALENYSGLAEAKIELLDYSENSTYLVENPTNGRKTVLRVCRPNYHTFEEIETELFFINSIDKNTSVEVAAPLPASNGEYICAVDYEDGQTYHCIMFEFMEGNLPEINDEEKLIKVFEELGEISAVVHNHVSKNWDEFKEKPRLTWDFETIFGENPKWESWKKGPDVTPERHQLFEKVVDKVESRLDQYGKSPERFGLIHCDLRHANLLVDGDDVRVIDFDDAGFSYYLFDLASALTFIEHRSYVPKLVESWLEGYRKVRELSDEEEQEIPTFIMMRRLQILGWLGSRDNETADELGKDYTAQTEKMAKRYLEDGQY